jgi:hypothetical protein
VQRLRQPHLLFLPSSISLRRPSSHLLTVIRSLNPLIHLPSISPLKQTIQTTTTCQRTHNSRANPTTTSTPAIVLILSLWRVALLRVHGLLLVLHGRLVVALLLAAVVVLAGGRAVALRRWRRAVPAGLLVWAGVIGLGWVGGRRAFGSFVGHCFGGCEMGDAVGPRRLRAGPCCGVRVWYGSWECLRRLG